MGPKIQITKLGAMPCRMKGAPVTRISAGHHIWQSLCEDSHSQTGVGPTIHMYRCVYTCLYVELVTYRDFTSSFLELNSNQVWVLTLGF